MARRNRAGHPQGRLAARIAAQHAEHFSRTRGDFFVAADRILRLEGHHQKPGPQPLAHVKASIREAISRIDVAHRQSTTKTCSCVRYGRGSGRTGRRVMCLVGDSFFRRSRSSGNRAPCAPAVVRKDVRRRMPVQPPRFHKAPDPHHPGSERKFLQDDAHPLAHTRCRGVGRDLQRTPIRPGPIVWPQALRVQILRRPLADGFEFGPLHWSLSEKGLFRYCTRIAGYVEEDDGSRMCAFRNADARFADDRAGKWIGVSTFDNANARTPEFYDDPPSGNERGARIQNGH